MKRLDLYRQTPRTLPRSHSPSDLVMMLAQITLERRRLDQERTSLQKRLRRIDGRLNAIAVTETKLVPSIQGTAQPRNLPSMAQPSLPPVRQRPVAARKPVVVVKY